MKLVLPLRTGLAVLVLSGVATAAPERWLLAESAAAAPFDWQVLAEDGSGVELELCVHWLELRHGLDGTRLELPGGGTAGLPGDPALPALSRLVALPGDADATLSILELETVTRRDWTPARLEAWTSDRPDSPAAAPAPPPVPADGPWPAQWVRLEESAVWHGVRVAGLDVSVVRWDEEPGELQALRRVRLRLDWERGLRTPPRLRAAGAETRALVAGSLLNPQGAWRAEAERVAEPPLPGAYLVLAPDAALAGLEEWVRWKRESGHGVRLILESELGGTAPSFNTLRQAVQAAFDEDPFEYLMLVGDIDRNPSGTETSFNLEAGFIEGGGYSESQWGGRCGSGSCIVSDHLFSLLEGDDYFADVLVGRLSVDNANDVVRTVRRLVDYEAAPFTGLGQDWFQRGLMIWDTAYAASRRETKLAIRDMLVAEAGFTQVDTISNHYQQNPVSPAIVTQRINSGVSVVNYRGYGFRDQWFGPNFGVGQMGALTNVGRWPLVTSIVCGGGDFASVDDDPCLGEAFLRAGSPMEPTGAIGFIGTSELDTHTEWNNCIDEGIYHGLAREGLRSLGALMDRGKFELWSSYPNARNWGATGYNVPFYLHAYNLLGDPGLEIRVAAPRELRCDVPGQLPAGLEWLELRATPEDGGAPAEIQGTLYHAATDLAVVARADADGLLRFGLGGMAAGEWILTLEGPDWLPLRGNIVAGGVGGLRVDGWFLSGSQPADSVARPGGEYQLNLRLLELGDAAVPAGRVLRLHLPAECGGALVDSLLLEAGEPGQEHLVQGLSFQLARPLPFGEPVPLRLTLDGALLELLELPVVQPGFRVEGASGVEGELEPGFLGHLAVQLRGLGLPAGEALVARLGALHDQVQLATRDSAPFLLEPDSVATLADFRLILDDGLLAGSLLPFELGVWRASAPPDTGPILALLPFQVVAGAVSATDPLGPDAGGYLAWHSGDQGAAAPQHVWESIAGTGQQLDLLDWSYPWSDLPDGVSQALDLPFVFRYYGRDYDRATVCSNGWLAFGDQEDWYTALNTPIPAAQGPSAMIAAYWTNLVNSLNGVSGFGHLYVESRPEEGLFIVEWSNFRPVESSSSVDVQLVLRDPAVWPTANGNGEILLHFHDVASNNGANGVTIGLENPNETGGLQVVCNNSYAPAQQPIVDGCSILFTPMETHTSVAEPATRPGARLEVGPNPFNPTTRLRLELPEAARWRWTLHNVAGQTVARSDWLDAAGGLAQAEVDGGRLSSGLYLVRVEWEPLAGPSGGVLAEKVLLVK